MEYLNGRWIIHEALALCYLKEKQCNERQTMQQGNSEHINIYNCQLLLTMKTFCQMVSCPVNANGRLIP